MDRLQLPKIDPKELKKDAIKYGVYFSQCSSGFITMHQSKPYLDSGGRWYGGVLGNKSKNNIIICSYVKFQQYANSSKESLITPFED